MPFPAVQVAMPGLPEPSGTPHAVAQSVGLFNIHEPESTQTNGMISVCWQIPGDCGKLHDRQLNLHVHTTIVRRRTLYRRFRRFRFTITNVRFGIGTKYLARYTRPPSGDSANFGTIFCFGDLPFLFICGHISRKKSRQ